MGLWRDSSVEDNDLLAENQEKDKNKTDLENNNSSLSEEEELDKVIRNSDEIIVEDNNGTIIYNANDSETNNDLRTKRKQKSQSEFSCIRFYKDLKTKCYAVVVDCYAKMFLCDFINCVITIFTYRYFGVISNL